jgi:hypothetical protein
MKNLVYIVESITFADLEGGRVPHVDVLEKQVRNWLLKPARHLAYIATLKTPSDPEHQELFEHFERTFRRLVVAPAATRVSPGRP